MKTLKFAEHLVPMILSGEKTSTWRMFDEKDLKAGDELSFLHEKTGKEFAQARIVSVEEKSLGKIDAADLVGHERYASREEMVRTFQSYYGSQVAEDTIVKMVDYELLQNNRGRLTLPKHQLFDELKRLSLPMGEYAIFGSGPLWVRGIRDSSDIDIITRGETWGWAKANGQVVSKETSGLECAQFADGAIEIYRDWYPGIWNIDTLIETAEIIEGIPFVRLESVMEWKKKMGREKDIEDLALINEYLSRNNG